MDIEDDFQTENVSFGTLRLSPKTSSIPSQEQKVVVRKPPTPIASPSNPFLANKQALMECGTVLSNLVGQFDKLSLDWERLSNAAGHIGDLEAKLERVEEERDEANLQRGIADRKLQGLQASMKSTVLAGNVVPPFNPMLPSGDLNFDGLGIVVNQNPPSGPQPFHIGVQFRQQEVNMIKLGGAPLATADLLQSDLELNRLPLDELEVIKSVVDKWASLGACP